MNIRQTQYLQEPLPVSAGQFRSNTTRRAFQSRTPSRVKHRVVLTGASGTLGRNFIERVGYRDDVRVLALLRQGSKLKGMWPSVEFARIDDFTRPLAGALINRFHPTCLVHCAATGMEFPRAKWFDLIRFNVDVTLSLCECVAFSIPRCHFIFVGTGLAYRPQGRPLTEDDPLDTQHPYGASKAAADLLVRSVAAEFEVPITVLRPFSFTGLGDDRTRLFATLLRSAATGQEMPLSAGTQIRDHCSARDIADGIVAAMDHEPQGAYSSRICNLGSGREEPLREMVENLVAELDLKVQLRFGARPFARFEPPHLIADIRRASAELGWKPRHNLAHAVWQLARDSFPELAVREPEEFSCTP